MTLRRIDRAVMCGLAFAWFALTAVQVTPGVIHRETTQTSAHEQTEPNPVVFYGPIAPTKHHHANDALLSRSDERVTPNFGAWIDFVATSYDGVDDGMNGTASGLTSTGTVPRARYTVAVDPGVIPYGTTIEVRFLDGSVTYLHAEDTGGAIRGNRIDIFNPSRAQCMTFGRQHVEVRIVKRK